MAGVFEEASPPEDPVDASPPESPVDAPVADETKPAVPDASDVSTPREHSVPDAAEWAERVGDGFGVWVSVDDQVLRVVEDGDVVWQAPCSTAANGTGSVQDSEKTPLGWHHVAEKIGDGAPWGRIFESRSPLGRCWKPGDVTDKDLVLTRILWLAGDEPGKNQGGNVDSQRRCIYIHGTNDEQQIGLPVSHGCVRLRNDDVITLFQMTPADTPVLITEERCGLAPSARRTHDVGEY